jgi:hypothetical protein
MLLYCGTPFLCATPSDVFPGGGAVAARCCFFVGDEMGAKRDLIAILRFFQGPFYNFLGWTVLSPLLRGLLVIVSTLN